MRHGGSHTFPAQSTSDNGHLFSAKPLSPYSVALRREREGGRAQAGQTVTIPRLSLSLPPHTHTRSPDRIACSHTFRPLSCTSSSFTRFCERWERSHKCQSLSNEPFVYRGNKKYACVTRILPVLSVNCNYLSPQTYFGIIWFPKYSTGENYLIQSSQHTSVSIIYQTKKKKKKSRFSLGFSTPKLNKKAKGTCVCVCSACIFFFFAGKARILKKKCLS